MSCLEVVEIGDLEKFIAAQDSELKPEERNVAVLFSVQGKVVGRRVVSKNLGFFDIQKDGDEGKLQLKVMSKDLKGSIEADGLLKMKDVKIGDVVSAKGYMEKNEKQSLRLACSYFEIVQKRPEVEKIVRERVIKAKPDNKQLTDDVDFKSFQYILYVDPHVPVLDTAVLLSLRFLKVKADVKFVFKGSSGSSSGKSEVDVAGNVKSLYTGMSYTCVGEDELPDVAKGSVLPCCLRSDGVLIVGLANLLGLFERLTDMNETWTKTFFGRSRNRPVVMGWLRACEQEMEPEIRSWVERNSISGQDLAPSHVEKINMALEHSNFVTTLTCSIADLVAYSFCRSWLKVLLEQTPQIGSEWKVKYERTVGWMIMMESLPEFKKEFVSALVGDMNLGIKAHNVENQALQPQTKDEFQLSKFRRRRIRRRDFPEILKKLETACLLPTYTSLKKVEGVEWEKVRELDPETGGLTQDRALRKKLQIDTLFHVLRSIIKNGDTVVDFCAGGGHLGIVIAYFYPKCKVILIDTNKESLWRAQERCKGMGLKNVFIFNGNLEYFTGDFDIGVSLHSCGVATDLILHKCFRKRASYVLCPCCFGSIRETATVSLPMSKTFTNAGLEAGDILVLGSSAEQTNWDFESSFYMQGKQSMGYVDLDRTLSASERSYFSFMGSLQAIGASPKNDIIFGSPKEEARGFSFTVNQ
eukprot:Nk52_evm1s554 gene=Nk52_evmTU1s554